MPRKIAFYLPRMTFLKVFGPVLELLLEQERQRFEPLILVPCWTLGNRSMPSA